MYVRQPFKINADDLLAANGSVALELDVWLLYCVCSSLVTIILSHLMKFSPKCKVCDKIIWHSSEIFCPFGFDGPYWVVEESIAYQPE